MGRHACAVPTIETGKPRQLELVGTAKKAFAHPTISDLILRSGVFAASRRMAASPCIASILRDACFASTSATVFGVKRLAMGDCP